MHWVASVVLHGKAGFALSVQVVVPQQGKIVEQSAPRPAQVG